MAGRRRLSLQELQQFGFRGLLKGKDLTMASTAGLTEEQIALDNKKGIDHMPKGTDDYKRLEAAILRGLADNENTASKWYNAHQDYQKYTLRAIQNAFSMARRVKTAQDSKVASSTGRSCHLLSSLLLPFISIPYPFSLILYSHQQCLRRNQARILRWRPGSCSCWESGTHGFI